MVALSLTPEQRRALISEYFSSFAVHIWERWSALGNQAAHAGLLTFFQNIAAFSSDNAETLKAWRKDSGFETEEPLKELLDHEYLEKTKDWRNKISDPDPSDPKNKAKATPKPEFTALLYLLAANYDLMVAIISFIELQTDYSTESNQSLREELLKAFNYDGMRKSQGGREFLRDMICETLQLRTCPYCNEQWTPVLSKVDSSDPSKIYPKIYPQMDHYFPKDSYPYLSRCIFNLIPSCADCNHDKSDRDTVPGHSGALRLWYPYEPEKSGYFQFSLVLKSVHYTDMIPDMTIVLGGTPALVEDAKDVLNLEQRYQLHQDYADDIYRNHQFYNRVYQEMINHALHIPVEQARSYWYMQPMESEAIRQRPLSKLTQDIVKQLDILDPPEPIEGKR